MSERQECLHCQGAMIYDEEKHVWCCPNDTKIDALMLDERWDERWSLMQTNGRFHVLSETQPQPTIVEAIIEAFNDIYRHREVCHCCGNVLPEKTYRKNERVFCSKECFDHFEPREIQQN